MTTDAFGRPPRLMRVLFDPLSYIHPSRLDAGQIPSDPGIRSAVNDVLLARYGLTDSLMVLPGGKDPAALLVERWRCLPHAIFLLGCHAAFDSLPYGGILGRLPEFARRFAQQPARMPRPALPPRAVSEEQLWQLGVRQLQPFCQRLPPALLARLKLMVPVAAEPYFHSDRRTGIVCRDTVLLTMALQHASRNLHQPCRFLH